MRATGIKELKAKLSDYVERVSHGEQIVITKHGKEVAVMVPVSNERKTIRYLIEAGKAQWSGGKPSGVKGMKIKGKPLSETVLERRR